MSGLASRINCNNLFGVRPCKPARVACSLPQLDHGFTVPAPVRDSMPSTEVQKLRSFVTFALDKLDAKDADLHDGSPEEDFQELVCRPTDPNLNPDPNPNPKP